MSVKRLAIPTITTVRGMELKKDFGFSLAIDQSGDREGRAGGGDAGQSYAEHALQPVLADELGFPVAEDHQADDGDDGGIKKSLRGRGAKNISGEGHHAAHRVGKADAQGALIGLPGVGLFPVSYTHLTLP